MPSSISIAKIRLNRSARRILWPRPAFYFPFGLLRHRGNVLAKDSDLYFCGYPRSGNTFASTAFLSANPDANLQSHRHIPAFVIQMMNSGVPGLVLLRKPLDAAVSWAIHQNQTLEEAVAYWNDYYETLLPYRSQLFVARFEDVTTDFGGVIQAFNQRWGTSYTPFLHTVENAARCFRATEEICREQQGEMREMMVCRPSKARRAVKQNLLDDLNQSDFLQRELVRANALYETFVAGEAGQEVQDGSEMNPAFERADLAIAAA